MKIPTPERASSASVDYLLQRLSSASSPNSRLLPDLLAALQWNGEFLQLRNAIAGDLDQMDEADLLNTLYNLGYRWKVKSFRSSGYQSLLQGQFPLLLQFEHGTNRGLRLATQAAELPPHDAFRGRVLVYRFSLLELAPNKSPARQWFQAQLLRFRSRIAQLYLISLFINLLALVPPYYIRSVYNQEIPSGELIGAFILLPFVLAVVALQIWLSYRRQNKLSSLAAQLDMVISTRVMERMLQLKLPQLERFSPLSLARRLRGYQGIRQFVTGPLAMAFLDLPYVVFYLAALASISVTLAVLTLVLVLLCMGGVFAVAWFGNAVQQPLRQESSEFEPMLIEMLQKLPLIKNAGDERVWSARLEGASAWSIQQSLGSLRLQELTGILTSQFSQLTGALVLAAGAGIALRGEGLELGTLLAAMFFVWRTFRPIQMLFQALNRWQFVGPSLAQLNRFMGSADGEQDSAHTQPWLLPDPRGRIELRNITLKLNDVKEAALSSISLKIPHGAFVVVTGPDGSGRSVLLKLLQGQYKPTSGHIYFDGADIRQYPISQLRSAVGYLSSDPEILPGTLRENFLLGDPLASDERIEQLCHDLGFASLLLEIGLDTVLLGSRSSQELSSDLAYGIGLVRLILSNPSVVLLDSPFNVLQSLQARHLLSYLQAQRGLITTLLVTDDPRVIAAADLVVLMRDGAIVFTGTPSELVSKQSSSA